MLLLPGANLKHPVSEQAAQVAGDEAAQKSILVGKRVKRENHRKDFTAPTFCYIY